jgi:hypothetical protein
MSPKGNFVGLLQAKDTKMAMKSSFLNIIGQPSRSQFQITPFGSLVLLRT